MDALNLLVASAGDGNDNPVFAVAFGVLFTLVGLVQAINPRILWRMNRWAYKNPDANEPSDAAFTLQRVVGVVLGVIGITFIVVQLT